MWLSFRGKQGRQPTESQHTTECTRGILVIFSY